MKILAAVVKTEAKDQTIMWSPQENTLKSPASVVSLVLVCTECERNCKTPLEFGLENAHNNSGESKTSVTQIQFFCTNLNQYRAGESRVIFLKNSWTESESCGRLFFLTSGNFLSAV